MRAVGTGVTPPGAVVPRLAPGSAPSRCAAPLPLREPTGVAGLGGPCPADYPAASRRNRRAGAAVSTRSSQMLALQTVCRVAPGASCQIST